MPASSRVPGSAAPLLDRGQVGPVPVTRLDRPNHLPGTVRPAYSKTRVNALPDTHVLAIASPRLLWPEGELVVGIATFGDTSDDASNHQRPSEENNGEIILNHDVFLSAPYGLSGPQALLILVDSVS